ncbi:MAG: HNH endonuclease, partial [Chlamydiales bacterium]|nr:HNH endonuclease [Chlamydiales bacterium]
FHALTKDQKKAFFKEITAVQKEMEEAGGMIKTKAAASPEWLPYVDLISRGALGHQNDGYQRAAALLRAHILLLVLIKMRDQADEVFAFEELHAPFRLNIAEDAFRQLLRAEPEIEETGGVYRYVPNRKAALEEIYEENVGSEIQKIKYENLALTEEEKLEKIKDRLRTAEKSPIVTTSRVKARERTVLIRHVRDPKTSALMRLYYKDVCQLCGFNGNNEYGIGIAEVDHAVHEISKTQNNRPSNLIVLCPNCHAAKTKGVIVISDHDDHFIAKNTFSGSEKRINKVQL